MVLFIDRFFFLLFFNLKASCDHFSTRLQAKLPSRLNKNKKPCYNVLCECPIKNQCCVHDFFHALNIF